MAGLVEEVAQADPSGVFADVTAKLNVDLPNRRTTGFSSPRLAGSRE
jgi:hypothetical protein